MPRRPKNIDFELGLYSPEIRESAADCIVDFFYNKYDRNDELLLVGDLLTEDNVNLVLKTKHTDKTFAFIHKHCLPLIPRPARYRETGISWQVSFLLSLLESMRKRRLPKEWQPGLVLLYFKLCKGVEIPIAT